MNDDKTISQNDDAYTITTTYTSTPGETERCWSFPIKPMVLEIPAPKTGVVGNYSNWYLNGTFESGRIMADGTLVPYTPEELAENE